MVLDIKTFEKVEALLNIPINYVCYNGSSLHGVGFTVGFMANNNLVSGVHLIVSEDFKIVGVKRIRVSWGFNVRNWPVVTDTLPIHPLGEIPARYS